MEASGYLLDKGANPNAKDVVGHTPLHIACAGGSSVIVSRMLAKGADVNINCTILEASKYLQCSQSVLDNDFSPEEDNDEEEWRRKRKNGYCTGTPLHFAVACCGVDVVKLHLSSKPATNIKRC